MPAFDADESAGVLCIGVLVCVRDQFIDDERERDGLVGGEPAIFRVALHARPVRPGKGAVEFWVSVVKPGRVMFEVANVTEALPAEAQAEPKP